MSMLTTLMVDTLDAGYAERAARRRAADAAPQRTRSSVLPIALVLAGLLLGTAAVQAQRREVSAAQTRSSLVREVERRTEATDALARDVAALRAGVEQTRSTALRLSTTGSAAANRLRRLELLTGVTPVRGPGLLVTVDDAPTQDSPVDSDPRGTGEPSAGRVLDRDLQLLVNGLWAAGAEAVSVNGQRITARTAIRSAGEAILVDYRPLSRPYEVRAIGDPRELEPAFVDGPGGRYLRGLQINYGVRLAVSRRSALTLPAGAGQDLRYARAPSPP